MQYQYHGIRGIRIPLGDASGQGFRGKFKSLLRKIRHINKGADLSEEIHDLMDEVQAKGLISDEESDMLYGVLELKETMVYSIMVPRTEISSAPFNSTLGELVRLVSDCGHTRIPIYKNTIDDTVGVLHAKDLLKLWGKEPQSAIPAEILRKPHFVSYNHKASEVLRGLRENKTHLAIVTDEYGGTAGIITIEDILEEIVGEIMDEHDKEDAFLTVIDKNTISVDARLEVEKLGEHFGVTLPKGEFESVGGFVIHLLGRIPKADEKAVFDHLEMTVQSADLRKIHKILVRHTTS
jgi:CBS domain containing-hemolysin-like protein